MKKIYIIFESGSEKIVEEKIMEYNAELVRIQCLWIDTIELKSQEKIYPIIRKYEEPLFSEADVLLLVNVFDYVSEYAKLIKHNQLIVIQNKSVATSEEGTPEIIKKRRLSFRD